MLLKCCTQHTSKFGKLSSGHRTGKGQFSFQSQRKAMSKNAQTTAQLHSSHRLVMKCSKFSKPGFNNMWTMNFQMFKLVLEKAECGERAPLLAKVMRKEAWHTQRRDQASGVSLEILEQSTPQTRVCLLSALCFHLHLWLYGGLSPTTSLKKVSLQLQLIIPGCDSV